MKTLKTQRGFTLIEMAVVMAFVFSAAIGIALIVVLFHFALMLW